MNQRLIVFTDLDGSLLDLDTYSPEPAQEAVRRLTAAGIPLVFCSSKTRAEQEYYQQHLGIRDPMIVENGAAIFIPEGYFKHIEPNRPFVGGYWVMGSGAPVSFIREQLSAVRMKLRLDFCGYGELSTDELCRLTGLDVDAAIRAQLRQYSETIVGTLTPQETFLLERELRARGLSGKRGSRFYTVTSLGIDKGGAVIRLTAVYREQLGEIRTIGIGDSLNDLPMLAAVDQAFLLQRRGGDWEATDEPGISRVRGTGPAAWSAIVNSLLDENEAPELRAD
jgi:mannosyl-3-phosphoglycerate phosphatase family protein